MMAIMALSKIKINENKFDPQIYKYGGAFIYPLGFYYYCLDKIGLIEKIKSSSISIEQAEKDTLDFFQKHIKQHKSPLCGSTVSHDRRFLIKYMPKLANHFHYRHLDVSSFKEVVKRWYPEEEEFEKKGSHRAMDDIKESVNELKFYREKFFK